MFLEKRVYQGSCGRVYPLPFTDRIAEQKTDRAWRAVWIENAFLRVLILPELGGRIHAIEDRSNGYDLIYRQDVIKPALVGLAGPWVSGGIEFNWPQHHRPATFLPVDFEVEEGADGSWTVWCSDHDPMTRMKGMHGVCLHPDAAYVELKARAYNRTPFVQTFLWWANVATRVHTGYQSFFPPDVHHVADHAKRAMSRYPLCDGSYYGVDYGARGGVGGRVAASEDGTPGFAGNDLSFYANIPTPCSYMAMGSRKDFFGGYDHRADAGIIHVANHHISPGKKQWTWGNHPFGYAWDRNLTDATVDGEFRPYIELMAGVYTDNQPDFSFLQPGETKSWSQFWYPIQKIGPACHANLDAAISLVLDGARVRVGVCVTRGVPGARILLERSDVPGGHGGGPLKEWTADLVPGSPFISEFEASPESAAQAAWVIRILDAGRREVLSYRPANGEKGEVPPPATEPPAPDDVASADELFLTGVHLEQYRHATRCPTLYWREALRRDPGDSRCHNAMGRWHLRRGEWETAEEHFRAAIARLTRRNPNPADGEPFYNLGLCLRFRAAAEPDPTRASALEDEAYGQFYKATWNEAWTAASYHALAEIDGVRGNWATARDHCELSSRAGGENGRVANLWSLSVRRLGFPDRADAMLRVFPLGRDRLDAWARHQLSVGIPADWQTALDVAHDYVRAGFFEDGIRLLEGCRLEEGIADLGAEGVLPTQSWGAGPLVAYTLGWLHERKGDPEAARTWYRRGSQLPPDYCFPARLEEIAILEAAMRADPKDARAPYYLGNLMYDRRRHEEAIALWERSASIDPSFSVVWRNLGIGLFNVRHQAGEASLAYDRAFLANPGDARLLFERDQLWRQMGVEPDRRLKELRKHPGLVGRRDDLSVEFCALLNQTGHHEEAAAVLAGRRFQPWEGGEGQALGQHVRTQLALGRSALILGNPALARRHFESAAQCPENLGEARHLLANDSDVRYWLGCALESLGDRAGAREQWLRAATFTGDFQEMSVREFSAMTRYSALACEKLGRRKQARSLFEQLHKHASRWLKAPAKIEYFATSLPTMLLFEDDLRQRNVAVAMLLGAQARLGLGLRTQGVRMLRTLLKRDPSHPMAADLLSECGSVQPPRPGRRSPKPRRASPRRASK